jgi:RNA polymerase sigma-70 factor (ECF subfamily)
MSYEALAEATGCAVGTAKSRVFRARRQLEAWLFGEGGSGELGQGRGMRALATLRERSADVEAASRAR